MASSDQRENPCSHPTNFESRTESAFLRKSWTETSEDEEVYPSSVADLVSPDTLPAHLQKLFTDSASDLSPEDQNRLVAFLQQNADVFAKSAEDLGHVTVVQHRIDTGQAVPIRQPFRRVPLHKSCCPGRG